MKKAMCGTGQIAGCRFSLYPMSDRFVELILGALKATDLSKVWSKTDEVSTCVRGKSEHVFDVVKSIFLHCAQSGVHTVLNATFSIGCPGDSEADYYMTEDAHRLNEERSRLIAVQTDAQFSLYPLGTPDYMDTIYDIIGLAREEGTFTKGVHYASGLQGDAHDVFATLEHAFEQAKKSDSTHIVLTANISAHSPSRKS